MGLLVAASGIDDYHVVEHGRSSSSTQNIVLTESFETGIDAVSTIHRTPHHSGYMRRRPIGLGIRLLI